jgi:HSP20 family protein
MAFAVSRMGPAEFGRRATPLKEASMIDRYEPFGRALGLRQLMDRLLEDAFVMPGGGEGRAGPSVDVYEEGDDLVVEAHLAGFKPEDLDIRAERGVLTISGGTESEQERAERTYLLRERRTGRFSRSLQLPAAYEADPSEATFEQGVLRLVFPKAEEAKPRRIQVSRGSQRATTVGQGEGQQSGEGATSQGRS